MKKIPLCFITVAALVLVAASSAFAATDQVVRIPYVVNVGGWSTGLAITNLSSTDITGLTLDLVKENGSWHSPIMAVLEKAAAEDSRSGEAPITYNYRASLGTLAKYAMMVDFLSTLYGNALPDNRMWCEVWHSGSQAFAVTVFVMNVTTGQAEGFGFHPFFSESRVHTFPIYVPL